MSKVKFSPKKLIVAMSLVAVLPMTTAVEAGTADVEKLQQQIMELQQALEQIKAAQQKTDEKVANVEKTAVTTGKGGAISIGDTSVKIGGYIKGDLLYTTNGVNGKNGLLAAAHVKGADSNKDDRVDLSARESRFFIKTATPVAGKTLKTHLEADFYGTTDSELAANGHGLRLRHAYGSWGNVLVGQTWSTFMDLYALGELTAFGQHASALFVRQAQVRYTHPYDGGSLMFALENPEDGGDDQSTPDLIARANFDGQWGHASVGMLAREISDGGDKEWSAAYSLSARFPTVGRDDLRMQFNYGELGRYMGLVTYPDVNGTATGIEGFNSWGASLAYRHFWNSQLRSNVMFSRTEADDNPYGTVPDSSQSFHANLIWSPSPKLQYGIEYANWQVDSSGTEKELDTVQLSARYIF